MNLTVDQVEMLRALERREPTTALVARFGRFQASELVCQLVSLRLAEPVGWGGVEISIPGKYYLRDLDEVAS